MQCDVPWSLWILNKISAQIQWVYSIVQKSGCCFLLHSWGESVPHHYMYGKSTIKLQTTVIKGDSMDDCHPYYFSGGPAGFQNALLEETTKFQASWAARQMFRCLLDSWMELHYNKLINTIHSWKTCSHMLEWFGPQQWYFNEQVIMQVKIQILRMQMMRMTCTRILIPSKIHFPELELWG